MKDLRLRIVYDNKDDQVVTYAEFDPKDFKYMLCKFFEEHKDVCKAFDITCEELKKKLLSM